MFSLNRATIIGHLTRDPELRTTPNGQNVTSFSVATNRRWTDASGAQQEATEFHDIVAWGKLAEIASSFLRKGERAYVEGRLQTRSWDGQDGAKRQKTEIVAENLINLTPKSSAAKKPDSATKDKDEEKEKVATGTKKKSTDEEEVIDIDEIPF